MMTNNDFSQKQENYISLNDDDTLDVYYLNTYYSSISKDNFNRLLSTKSILEQRGLEKTCNVDHFTQNEMDSVAFHTFNNNIIFKSSDTFDSRWHLENNKWNWIVR